MSLVLLREGDDVAVATRALDTGADVRVPGGPAMVLRSDVPAGHKVALRDLGGRVQIVPHNRPPGRNPQWLEIQERG